MNNLEGKIEQIGKVFSSDFFFTIPDYQRPFAWEESNFQDLIDDLISANGGEQYFLGVNTGLNLTPFPQKTPV